jgi:hypothetical protein
MLHLCRAPSKLMNSSNAAWNGPLTGCVVEVVALLNCQEPIDLRKEMEISHLEALLMGEY